MNNLIYAGKHVTLTQKSVVFVMKSTLQSVMLTYYINDDTYTVIDTTTGKPVVLDDSDMKYMMDKLHEI